MAPTTIRHDDGDALAAALAQSVAEAMRAAIKSRGRARLAVPGGTTPGPFLTALGGADVNWDRVAVTLTDERWVPVSSPRSNQGLLSKTLFSGPAAAAEFVPLYGATAEPANAMDAINTALARIVLPLDVIVLGMGEDMHTASLFPGADRLAAALAPDAPAAMVMRAPGAEEPRVTLTAPVIAAAGKAILLIRGQAKLDALDRAMQAAGPQDAPVRVALDRAGPTEIWFAP